MEGEIKNIWIAKKIKQKWLDGIERIGSAKLEEDDGDRCALIQIILEFASKRAGMPLKSHRINPMPETPVLRILNEAG